MYLPRWSLTPSRRLTCALQISHRDSDAGIHGSAAHKRCRRIVEITAIAKVFGIGSVIEKVLENSFRDGWQHSAEYVGKWVKEKGL